MHHGEVFRSERCIVCFTAYPLEEIIIVKQHTGFISDRGCPDVLGTNQLNITEPPVNISGPLSGCFI